MFDIDFIRNRYGIGSYGVNVCSQMYDKLILIDSIIESLQYYQNGSFKIKFKDSIHSSSFLLYCGL